MDCNENGMFYQVQKNGDWISSNSDMYNDFLGIGTEKGFLGLRKVLYPQSYQMRYGRKQKIEPIKSIGLKPLKIDYGTPTRVTTTFGTKKVPSGLGALPKEDREDVQKTSFLSTLFGGQIDELLMSKPIPNFNEPADTTKRQTTRRTSLDETKDYNLEDARAKLKKLEEDGKPKIPKNNTLLYVGLAGAGILLISGFAYMSSKGN
jgi:hypothetical protein